MINRRNFLGYWGLGLAAPPILHATNLMPISTRFNLPDVAVYNKLCDVYKAVDLGDRSDLYKSMAYALLFGGAPISGPQGSADEIEFRVSRWAREELDWQAMSAGYQLVPVELPPGTPCQSFQGFPIELWPRYA